MLKSTSSCREAKRTLPKPKVGDFCSLAMEQGFSDVCVPLCMGNEPKNRIVEVCRAAAIEMPRPTVRRWCEYGYDSAFTKSLQDLQTHFRAGDGRENSRISQTEKSAVTSEALRVMVDRGHGRRLVVEVGGGESPEDAVLRACKESGENDVSSCIRKTLPIVLERLEELNS